MHQNLFAFLKEVHPGGDQYGLLEGVSNPLFFKIDEGTSRMATIKGESKP